MCDLEAVVIVVVVVVVVRYLPTEKSRVAYL